MWNTYPYFFTNYAIRLDHEEPNMNKALVLFVFFALSFLLQHSSWGDDSVRTPFPPEGAASVTEPAKDIPIAREVDVVVAGGGISGVFAALGAAQSGASVILIERFESIGGTAGPGMNVSGGIQSRGTSALEAYEPGDERPGRPNIPHTWIYPELPGLADRFQARMDELIGPNFQHLDRTNAFGYVATEMLLEAGVELMLGTFVCDPVMDAERTKVQGVFVENKSGRQAILASVVIDATGEADVARRAGAEVLWPKPEYHEMDDHAPGGVGTWAYVGGIDWETHRSNMGAGQGDEIILEFDDFEPLEIGNGLAKVAFWRPGGGGSLFYGANQAGELGIIKVQLMRPHDEVDVVNIEHLTAIQIGFRKFIYELVADMRERAPGCENLHVVKIPEYIANRGGPRIAGEYTLTLQDCMLPQRFDDVIYLLGEIRAMRHVFGENPEGIDWHKWADVPYRVTVPVKIDGLLATGRTASGTPDTLLRNRTAIQAMGQAVGTAAAIAARNSVQPRHIDVRELQKALLADGFFLGDDQRLQQLGLKN